MSIAGLKRTALIGLLLSCASVGASDIAAEIEALYDDRLGALFEHLHRNPELSNHENKTSARLASELKAAGYRVTTGVGGTGVVAVLRNGAGPTVLVRADMDGLPIAEASGLSYASTARQVDTDGVEKPVMHACGHDVHMTSLVGTARVLAARKSDWSGTLVLIGQPAEERLSGARAMIEDGLYRRFPKPDYAIGFHVQSGLPAGLVAVAGGVILASSDSVDIQVRGVGTHGAYPHGGIDPVLVASQIVVSLQSIISRNISPLQPAVITVGAIHGGSKHNIIGERVDLQLTVRADTPQVREQVLDAIDRVADGVARSLNVPEDRLPIVVRSPVETTPPLRNDAELAEQVLRPALVASLGEQRVLTPPRTGMGSEDFAVYIEPEHGVRGVFLGVGGTGPDDLAKPPPHHSPLFRIEPRGSVIGGTEAMVVSALALLGLAEG